MASRKFLILGVVLALIGAGLYFQFASQAGAGKRQQPLLTSQDTRPVMGTLATVTVAHEDRELAQKALEAAFAEMERLATLWNKYNADSEVGRLNRTGTSKIEISADTLTLLQRAKYFSELSSGAFDITVEPLLRVWKKCEREQRMPTDAELREAVRCVGYKDLQIMKLVTLMQRDPSDGRTPRQPSPGCFAVFQREGMAIDVGAIAKGEAADLVAMKLAAMGIESALVDIGGDIRALNGKPGQGYWTVAVRDPQDAKKLVAKLRANGNAITTSGNYERFLTIGEKKINHIIDPRTGEPADKCRSVTIVTPTAADADAFATAVFVLGPEEGMKLVESRPDTEALIIDSAGKQTRSTGFAAHEIR
jgi:thiamine biosynthesis lipoprotein